MAGFLAGLLLLAGVSCREKPFSGEDYAIELVLSTNSIRVGDPIVAMLKVAHPASARVQWPAMAQERAVVIREQGQEIQPLDKDRALTTERLVFTSLEVGAHSLSTGLVTFALADGTTHSEPFPTAGFEVVSSLSSTNDTLRDIKGMARWPAALPRWIWVLALVAVLALLLGWLAARTLARPRTILHYPPPTPPHEVALRALRALQERGYIERGESEPFYVELSAIIRHYIEGRFGLRAPEQTTEEFIRDASSSGRLQPAHQELVREFLEHSDLVKFARFRPEAPQMRDAFAAAERLVRETIPAPQEAAA